MIRHVFTTGAKPGTSDKEIDLFISKLREALTGKVPGLLDFHVGRNLGYYDHKAVLVVVADLEDKQAYDNYITFPDHLAVGKKYGSFFDPETMYASQIEI